MRRERQVVREAYLFARAYPEVFNDWWDEVGDPPEDGEDYSQDEIRIVCNMFAIDHAQLFVEWVSANNIAEKAFA